MSATLSLINQESLAQIFWSKNDIQKKVHCVAKNIPFVIEVGCASVNFNNKNTRIIAKLCYDSNDGDFKPVDYLKQEPMTFKAFGAENKVTIEFRLTCLSSQHEDSCFRIKIQVVSPQLAQPLEVVSEPIRVVSKASQVNKEKARCTPRASDPSTPPAKLSGTKRAAPSTASNDVIQDTLMRLEQQQQEQRALLEQLVQQQKPQQSMDFDTAFANFITAFRNTPCEERATKIRKVICSSPDSTDALGEFIMLCATTDYNSPQSQHDCAPVTCETVDPAGTENVLEAWNLICSELTSPESDTCSLDNEQDSGAF